MSFEPDIVSVQLDGKQLRLAPGQTVIPHGSDRNLTVAEVLHNDLNRSEVAKPVNGRSDLLPHFLCRRTLPW
jgi:hypothetical protein